MERNSNKQNTKIRVDNEDKRPFLLFLNVSFSRLHFHISDRHNNNNNNNNNVTQIISVCIFTSSFKNTQTHSCHV